LAAYDTWRATGPRPDVEGAVLDHVQKLLAAPEPVVRTWAAAKREREDEITERDITVLLAGFATVWSERFPAMLSVRKRWSMDFQHELLATGQRLRTLNIVDDVSRECPAIEVDTGCLNEHWFLDRADARQTIEAWRLDDNNSRPHSALGYATPQEFAAVHQGHAPGELTTGLATATIDNHDSPTE
jgi:transposase InsO family protein